MRGKFVPRKANIPNKDARPKSIVSGIGRRER
jgi:hypothetical protein